MGHLVGDSNDPNTAAVRGTNSTQTAGGAEAVGVFGECKSFIGVKGVSEVGTGVNGVSPQGFGVAGESDTQFGVIGICKAFIGVKGVSEVGTGVNGVSPQGFGVAGESDTQFGVIGICKAFIGVKGVSEVGTGVNGVSPQGFGVAGESDTSLGVLGISKTGQGVEGRSTSGVGVSAESDSGVGISAKGGRLAGFFEGHVQVTGDFRGEHVFAGNVSCSGDVALTGGDCAEHFDAAPDAMCAPGTVMTISIGGALDASSSAYDKKVAGVVSGAGKFRPAIILDKQPSDSGRPPVALTGKVYCKVDAEYAAIETGDLLTTSDTLGHAMKASEPQRAFGAVVGKALGPLASGRGIIPILVSLQ